MLQHIALNINNKEDIKNFYCDILLFCKKNSFSIDKTISKQIFSIDKTTDVFVLEHQNLQFEIFVNEEKEKKIYSHICLAYWQADKIYYTAINAGYKGVVKTGNTHNTYFIWDNSNNLFEIKEILE